MAIGILFLYKKLSNKAFGCNDPFPLWSSKFTSQIMKQGNGHGKRPKAKTSLEVYLSENSYSTLLKYALVLELPSGDGGARRTVGSRPAPGTGWL